MESGQLHLIPSFLAAQAQHSIPSYLIPVITEIKIWYVEEIRSARRFLKAMNKDIVIDELTFYTLNEHKQEDLQLAAPLFKAGHAIGMMSEAGCPAVADPGSLLVQIAHQCGAQVKPYVGPNSILLALMASGFNGQQFHFQGYLPNKQPALTQALQELERNSITTGCSHFFIETPYRNNQLLQEILRSCKGSTRLCIAANLTGDDERIYSMPILDWKKQDLSFHKQPAVFGLYAGL